VDTPSKWWGGIVENYQTECDIKLVEILKRHFFLLSMEEFFPNDTFFERLRDFFLEICPNITYYDPCVNLKAFSCFLYDSKHILNPNTIESAITLFNQCCRQNPSILITKGPLIVGNSVLYFQTLRFLLENEHDLFFKCFKSFPLVDTFINFYSFMVNSMTCNCVLTSFWDQRINMCSIIYMLLENNFKTCSKSISYIDHFCSGVIRILPCSIVNDEFCLVRWILSLTQISLAKTPRDYLHERFQQLLSISGYITSPSYLIVLKYIIDSKPKVFPGGKLLRIISDRGIICPQEIEMLSRLTSTIGPLPVLNFLCRMGLSSKVWHRLCFLKVREIIVSYPSNVEISEWIQLFIRRLLMFIPLASKKLQYRTKTMLICETISNFATLRMVWVQQCVAVACSSIYSTKLTPPFYSNFFPINGPIDSLISSEMIMFWNCPPPLKRFPFEAKSMALVMPPSHESTSSQGIRTHRSTQKCSPKNNSKNGMKKMPKSSSHEKSNLPLLKGFKS